MRTRRRRVLSGRFCMSKGDIVRPLQLQTNVLQRPQLQRIRHQKRWKWRERKQRRRSCSTTGISIVLVCPRRLDILIQSSRLFFSALRHHPLPPFTSFSPDKRRSSSSDILQPPHLDRPIDSWRCTADLYLNHHDQILHHFHHHYHLCLHGNGLHHLQVDFA